MSDIGDLIDKIAAGHNLMFSAGSLRCADENVDHACDTPAIPQQVVLSQVFVFSVTQGP